MRRDHGGLGLGSRWGKTGISEVKEINKVEEID